VTYTVTATDLCVGTNVSLVCSPLSGSTFALGTTMVTCWATDPSGNSNSCSFNVTINPLTNCGPDSCPTNYTITVFPGVTNLIANQLDNGSNTLAEVLPNVPNGAALYKFDPVTQSFSEPAVFVSGLGWVPNLTLDPGEGAYLSIPTGEPSFDLTFTGTRRCTSHLLCLVPGFQLVSAQMPEEADFFSIVGFAPVAGTRVFRQTPDGFTTNVFDGSAWSPAPPAARVGEAWFLEWPGCGELRISPPDTNGLTSICWADPCCRLPLLMQSTDELHNNPADNVWVDVDPALIQTNPATGGPCLVLNAMEGIFETANMFNVGLSEGQEVPSGTNDTAVGSGRLKLSGNTLTVRVDFSGLSGPATAAHIHGPAMPGVKADVLYPLTIRPPDDTSVSPYISQTITLAEGMGGFTIAQQINQLRHNLWYVNVHSAAFPDGEIRGQVMVQQQFFRAVIPQARNARGAMAHSPNAPASVGTPVFAKGFYYLIANPLKGTPKSDGTPNNDIANVLLSPAIGTTVITFIPGTAQFDPDVLIYGNQSTGWIGSSGNTNAHRDLPPGVAFLIRNDQFDQRLIFVGEVPTGDVSISLPGLGGYAFIASTVPQTEDVEALGLSPGAGDVLLKFVYGAWDPNPPISSGTPGVWVYPPPLFNSTGNLGPPPTIGVGEGFLLINDSGTATWNRVFSIH
jgi:hypothetical protein